MSPSIQERFGQEDFSAGSQMDVAPELIDDTGGYLFQNTVLDDDGSAYRRGGSKAFSSNNIVTGGRFLFDGILNLGRRTIVANQNDTFVLDADDATLIDLDTAVGMPYPKQTAVMKGLLFIGGGGITAGARTSSTVTASTVVSTTNGSKTVTRSGGSWATTVKPGHLMKIGSGRVYEVASTDSATQVTLRENYAGSTASGQTANFYPIYRHVGGDPYGGEEYVCVSNNRLVYAENRTIRFSEIDNPHSFQSFDFHELPTGAIISGLADLGGKLIVFTTDGIWVIEGLSYDIVDDNGNGQHRVERLSEVVLAGVAGIAGFEQQLVIPAANGIYLMDGMSSPVKISAGIERPYKAWLKGGYRLGKGVIFNGHYILPICSSSGVVKDTFVCRLDRPVKTRYQGQSWPWTKFKGDGGEIPAFAVRHGQSQLTPQLLGVQGRTAAKIVDCSDFFNPDSPQALDADGTAPVVQIVTRDYETGNMTENLVRALRVREILRGTGALVKVEYSEGGENFDVAGSTSPLRLWGDVEGDWADADGLWGEGFGPADSDVVVTPPPGPVWIEITPSPGESNGIDIHKMRVDHRCRFIRFRFTLNGRVDAFRFRSLEATVRPSRAVRI